MFIFLLIAQAGLASLAGMSNPTQRILVDGRVQLMLLIVML
jgi:hypothetical protein